MTWSWVGLDGKNVAAVVSHTRIDLLDTQDFSLLGRIVPGPNAANQPFHDTPILLTQWNARRASLVSLSSTVLMIHCPDPVAKYAKYRVSYAHAWSMRFEAGEVTHLALSRCSYSMLMGGPRGISLWECSPNDESVKYSCVWRKQTPCDQLAFSPSRCVFATAQTGATEVYVWRQEQHDDGSNIEKQILGHDEGVVYISWKPATHNDATTSDDSNGQVPSKWFQPERMLLTMTAEKTIRIWTEKASGCGTPLMQCVVFIQPQANLDIAMTRWVLPRTRNISEELFASSKDDGSKKKKTREWLSVIDTSGVLHVWQLTGLDAKPRLKKTDFTFKVDGNEDDDARSVIKQVQVIGYFSQTGAGDPSALSILLERTDHVLLSYRIDCTSLKYPILKDKSWHRGHTEPITALATHPSLPLVATTSAREIMVFWLSLSTFTNVSKLVPSCIMTCDEQIASIQWIPTKHFDAVPLLLVTMASGVFQIYSTTGADQGKMLSSPKPGLGNRLRLPSMHYPWTYYSHELGESGFEYEVGLKPDPHFGLGLTFDTLGEKLVVTAFVHGDEDHNHRLPGQASGQIDMLDQCVSVNGVSVKGFSLERFRNLVYDTIASTDGPVTLRFRSSGGNFNDVARRALELDDATQVEETAIRYDDDEDEEDDEADDGDDVSHEDHAQQGRRLLARVQSKTLLGVDSVGSVSLYGGWRVIGSESTGCVYEHVSVAPVYSDAGAYTSDVVLIFAIEAASQELHAYLGTYLASTHATFYLHKLEMVSNVRSTMGHITVLGTERDYRQRAFSSIVKPAPNDVTWNALLFVGDATGAIQHWRCRVTHQTIDFSLIHACEPLVTPSPSPSSSVAPHQFFRRGHAMPSEAVTAGVYHIEMDDPNRLAVLYADRPNDVYVWEGESGLGILRLEACISSQSNWGPVTSFSWCSGHVEFHIDPLAIQYVGGVVIYTYDAQHQTWLPLSKPIVTGLTMFDCTRDASALILACGVSDGPLYQCAALNDTPTIVGKWDEPGRLRKRDWVQYWNRTTKPKHCPVWHPYVLLTTLCGLPARVGLVHTALADYRPAFDFHQAFGETVQLLKLLARVLEDDMSTDMSAQTGVLIVLQETPTAPASLLGRYANAKGNQPRSNRAMDLFAPSPPTRTAPPTPMDEGVLNNRDIGTLTTAIDAVLRRLTQKVQVRYEEQEHRNAYVLFESFEVEHGLQFKAVLSFLQKMQHLSLNGYDVPAQRYVLGHVLSTCLQDVLHDADDLAGVFAMPVVPIDEAGVAVAGGPPPTVEGFLHDVPASSVSWALQSESQNVLLEQCLHPQALWDDLKPMWLGLWVRDPAKLREIVERMAKCTFMRTRDAMSVSLLYLALGKKNVLGALAKVSRVESNKTLADFLVHDFSEERWSTAAVRNAYSLLRKKQYDLAAAFFLLPQPPRLQEALRICIGRLNDPSLAMIIARLVETASVSSTFEASDIYNVGPLTAEVLKTSLVPLFREQENRWLESTALWWLGEYEQASAVLTPSGQPIDVVNMDALQRMLSDAKPNEAQAPHMSIALRTKMSLDFFINLTSLSLHYQYLYCEVKRPLVHFAYTSLLEMAPTKKEEDVLTTSTDVDHAYSFGAYVCKHVGLNDTALLQMLQARHLLNIHVKKNFMHIIDAQHQAPTHLSSPRSEMDVYQRQHHWYLEPKTSSSSSSSNALFGSPRSANVTRRRSSFSLAQHLTLETDRTSLTEEDWQDLLHGAATSPSSTDDVPSLWPKHEIADIECRRWSSSAFVGKMIGLRVAREMISHFRLSVKRHIHPLSTRVRIDHVSYLNDLCAPLCAQFRVDRQYILEATLGVLQPHAQMHMVECCFLLSELSRDAVMHEWVNFVSLNMLHSSASFTTCQITAEVFRDWEHLTIQLCYLQHLFEEGTLALPRPLRAVLGLAIRLGSLLLVWCTNQPQLLLDVTSQYEQTFAANLAILKQVNMSAVTFLDRSGACNISNFGYSFLEQFAAVQPGSHLLQVRRLYTTILMVQLIRTLFCNGKKVLADAFEVEYPLDETTQHVMMYNALYAPKKLWKHWVDAPLTGLKRWYLSMEAHVLTEFHDIVKDTSCFCGHFGLDQLVRPVDVPAPELPTLDLAHMSDEMIMLYMNHPKLGVTMTMRRFRLEPRVYVPCFTLKDAFAWLSAHHLCATVEEAQALLGRWCLNHKLRWLVRRRSRLAAPSLEVHVAPNVHHTMSLNVPPPVVEKTSISPEAIPDEAFFFVNPWEVDAPANLARYMLGMDPASPPKKTPQAQPSRVDLGWDTFLPMSDQICEEAAGLMFPDSHMREVWKALCGEGWFVTAVQHFDADGGYIKTSSRWKETVTHARWLTDVFKQVQRNKLFRHLGLPHRLVAVLTVKLVAGSHLIPSDLLGYSADPYVFFQLSYPRHESPRPTPNGWAISTYRSRHAVSTLEPTWNSPDDVFVYRFALPVHEAHAPDMPLASSSLEALQQQAYSGPPTDLYCSVYNKCKVRSHPFMGQTKVSLLDLAEDHPLDVWAPLQDVASGSLHLVISVKYTLMSSTSYEEDFVLPRNVECDLCQGDVVIDGSPTDHTPTNNST
ncbi:hypothetical protein SDRG_09532 [Saprolegnia diclina VS20]|uniref:C2 domain-containing protein n=1 Tax=Saprolegnia diclina (strain VS20) TaxID=1156394 RepID=T0QE60_SAPDV|nr:hypothetical protein SDRG_09532 [Saprolegnia diclina VS20]EQC33011.1 hypothetical protein SDRG_09532 [Saprolegnia diclina VS20]|eukprot:XP_008613697.1 hypothetical protein SDRG_09532 [Saprolegnia diclina VS20]